VPLRLAPFPESPFVLLNVLSFAALCALAWYVGRRLPSLPAWLVWGWMLTAPWTLQFSTHINNPSYVLPAGVAFFIGFFEATPALSLGAIRRGWAFAMMGAAITWMMQVHMSWPLLLPYLAVAIWMAGIRYLAAAAAGAVAPALLLLPTFLEYGLAGGSGGGTANLHLHVVPPDRLLITLAQFFSFASLELSRFLANDLAKRLAFLQAHVWIVPAAVVAAVAGLLQPIWMLTSWFRRAPGIDDWLAVRRLVAFTVALVYVSYWFVTEEPQAHAFYVVAPIAFVYAACCWRLIDGPRWRRVAAVALGANIAYHAGLAAAQGPNHSLYANREVIAEAIRRREPELFAHRRPYAIDGGPAYLTDPSRPFHIRDIVIDEAGTRVAFGRAIVWQVAVRNTNPRVAFRNLIYIATYRGSGGEIVARHEDVITDVIQPGETERYELADTIVERPFMEARIEVVAGEAILPTHN
jgi:hypothetical protein